MSWVSKQWRSLTGETAARKAAEEQQRAAAAAAAENARIQAANQAALQALMAQMAKQQEDARKTAEENARREEANRLAAIEAERQKAILAENQAAFQQQSSANQNAINVLSNLNSQQKAADSNAASMKPQGGPGATLIEQTPNAPAAAIGAYGASSNPGAAYVAQANQQQGQTSQANKFAMPNTTGITFGGG